MTGEDTPTDWGGAPLGPDPRWTKYPKRMAMQVATRVWLDRYGCLIEPPQVRIFHPTDRLTGLALRLFAVSNAFKKCGSERID